MKRIKAAFINFWVWITPRAAKNQIQSDFMRQLADPNRPKFASNLTAPLRTRVDYGAVGRSMIQVQKFPED
jgi:hypothetical protein